MTKYPDHNNAGCREPFFLLFPWAKVGAGLLGLYLGCMFVYRLSHAGGEGMSQACFAALAVSLAAGGAGAYPISKFWGQDQWRMLAGFFLGILIRLLIGGAGFTIITLFTDINQITFVLFLKLYYVVFLVSDTWLAVWMLHHSPEPRKKETVYGNLWDIVERL